MNAKILNTLLIVLGAAFLSGCSTKVVYKDRVVEVIKPVQCKVPKVSCNITEELTYTEVVNYMALCILDLNEAAKVCQ